MKMKKRIKQGAAAALALMLKVPAAMYTAQAAVAINTEKKCTVTFQVEGTFDELKTLEIPVNFYQVAEVDETGAYEALAVFESLELGTVNDKTTAQEWEEKASAAMEIIQEDEIAPALTTTVEAGASGLPVGMYLVEAQEVQSPEYTYSFTPYLLALPNNYYSETNPDDSWQYNPTTGLKPEQEIRYGGVEITKTLDVYNQTLGGASFIFSIEAEKDGEKVYSDVVSLTFDGPGTRSLEVGEIPAGAQVTVTEVYSGSSYTLVSAASQDTDITADTFVPVSFANTYNGENNGGSSIVNHFTYTAPEEETEPLAEGTPSGTWEWSQQTDSSQVQE